MAFTKLGIDKLKKKECRYDVWEGGNRGFGIRVYPTGTKTWLYKYTLNGKRKTILLGNLADVPLDDARTEHASKEALVKEGIDPAKIKQDQRQQRINAKTFNDLVEMFFKKPVSKRKKTPLRAKTVAEYKRLLDNDLLPEIGWMKVEDIERRHIREIIENVEDRAGNAARQLYKVTKRLFNFAVEKDIIGISPMAGMETLGTEGTKDRNLTTEEIRIFWIGLNKVNMSDGVKRALKLILLTGQRPGEIIGAHSSEFEDNWWTIPMERSKNGKAHRVYVTKLAEDLFEINGRVGHLFPTRLTDKSQAINPLTKKRPKLDKPIAENALPKALRRALTGREMPGNPNAEPSLKMDMFTPHDLRRTAATQISKLGFGIYVDKILNHTDNRVTAIYDRHDYDKEKQKALKAWGRKLETIVSGNMADNVIPMTRRK